MGWKLRKPYNVHYIIVPVLRPGKGGKSNKHPNNQSNRISIFNLLAVLLVNQLMLIGAVIHLLDDSNPSPLHNPSQLPHHEHSVRDSVQHPVSHPQESVNRLLIKPLCSGYLRQTSHAGISEQADGTTQLQATSTDNIWDTADEHGRIPSVNAPNHLSFNEKHPDLSQHRVEVEFQIRRAL